MSDHRVRLNPMRRYIGKALRESVVNYPQASGFFQADTTRLFALKNKWSAEGKSVSFTAFICKAIAIALKDFPELNARADGDYAILYDEVNIGVAIADRKGLFVMTVPDCQEKSPLEISDCIKALTQKVREGRVVPEDMGGATISISSAGTGRTEIFTSIITNDQALIVGVGRTKKQPVVLDDDSIAVRQMTWLATNMNHLLVDGSSAAGFRNRMGEILEEPERYFVI